MSIVSESKNMLSLQSAQDAVDSHWNSPLGNTKEYNVKLRELQALLGIQLISQDADTYILDNGEVYAFGHSVIYQTKYCNLVLTEITAHLYRNHTLILSAEITPMGLIC